MKLDSLGEFGLIDLIQIPAFAPEQLILGIGDDCAVLPLDDTFYQLVSCDLLVEDVHFIRGRISPYHLGYKSVAVNLSDVAAMGGKPVHILLSMALPADYTVEEWQEFYRGVEDICKRYRVNIIGGDTTSADKLTINVTVLGKVAQNQLHLRKDAQPGDIVFVTGTLGGSRAGLEMILHEDQVFSQLDTTHLLQCHCKPEPCCEEIGVLNNLAGEALHALNDISDGLLSECGEIAKASDVALRLQTEKIPVDEDCRHLAEQVGADGLQWAMTGGEDYQLVGTIAAEKAAEIKQQYEILTGKPLFFIGTVHDGKGVYLQQNGKWQIVQQKGYNHFDKQNETNWQVESASDSQGQRSYEMLLEEQQARLERQEEAQRVYRHDLQNHFVCLSGLLECGNVEQARSYLRELQSALPVSETKQYSQRIVLNSLLNQKAALAEAKQMDFQFSGDEHLLDFISDYDLCIMIGNLLDNGIEHSACQEEAYLYLDILQNEAGFVLLRMENSCERVPCVQNGHLCTQKADPELHGKGIEQIKRITQKYGGAFSWIFDSAGRRFFTQCQFSTGV